MALSGLFAIRGFLAFVAFMELVNAFRSLFPRFFTLPEERLQESFIHKKIFSNAELTEDSELILSQLFGFYSLLNGIVISHAAVFVHYWPVISVCFAAVFSKTLFYLLQGIYGTIPATSGLQVPLIIGCLTLFALGFLPHFVTQSKVVPGNENEELLRGMRAAKKRNSRKQL